MGMLLVWPALTSPVSATLLASLGRPFTTGRSAASLFVLMTTNSWVMVPALCARNVTRPARALGTLGVTANWASATSTLRGSGAATGLAAAAAGVRTTTFSVFF